MSFNELFSGSPPGPLKIFGSNVGENTPEVFKKSRIFLWPFDRLMALSKAERLHLVATHALAPLLDQA